ncbi:hypothetical protein AGMMS49965_19740 [Bacteroidia bacterium]|nr:hypothetical protein AGMMS49965_19740 [Bacteroidia bacterium]
MTPESLRFDFSHFQKVTDEEIRRVEQIVTAKIREDFPLDERRHVPIAEATSLGAMALFGEKYGDYVRVVRFGSSVELCGGTHIASTGRIGSFRILAESSVAAGIRRIEAITAENVEKYFDMQQDILRSLRAAFNNAPDLVQTIRKFVDENADLKKQVEGFVKEKLVQVKKQLIESKQQVNGINLFVLRGPFSAEMVKDLALQIRSEFLEKACFVAATTFDSKPLLTVMLSDDLVKDGWDASQIVRDAAKHIQGGGGGQPHFATAGGKEASGLAKALDEMIKKV